VTAAPPAPPPRFHGRRHGRRLRPGRQARLASLLPALRIDPAVIPAGDPARLFPFAPDRVWLEIGFGAGERLAALAAALPDVGFLGCEPYVNGVAALLAEVERRSLQNIRIFDDDVRRLLPALADASLARIDVPFPDPWPKLRHHHRRLVAADTVAAFARLLRDDGELRFASDNGGYVAWALERILADPAFQWTAGRPADWRQRPADEPVSRYAEKAAERGVPCVHLRFRRRPRCHNAGGAAAETG